MAGTVSGKAIQLCRLAETAAAYFTGKEKRFLVGDIRENIKVRKR